MKNTILTPFLFLFFLNGWSQDFNFIQKDMVKIYHTPDEKMNFFSIDSIIENGDSTWLFPHKIPDINFSKEGTLLNPNICVNPDKPFCWMTGEILQTSNQYYFLNLRGDTLSFKRFSSPSDEWKLADFGEDGKLMIKHIKNDTLTILGVTDSIRKYEITWHNQADTKESTIKQEFIVAKEHGIAKTPEWFWIFSENSFNTSNSFSIYKESSELTDLILTGKEIYDFSIGDEFHYRYYYNSENPISYQLKVLNKIINQDSYAYTMRKTQKELTVIYPEKEYPYNMGYKVTVDTLNYNYPFQLDNQDSIITPGELFSRGYDNFEVADIYEITSKYNSRLCISTPFIDHLYKSEENCLQIQYIVKKSSHTIGSYYNSRYTKGLGFVYGTNAGPDPGYNSEELVFYKLSSGESWGSPVSINSMKDLERNEIKVVPNPVNHMLRIEGIPTNAFKIEIADLTGKIIKTIAIHDSGLSVEHNISDLPSGIYNLIISSKDNSGKTFTKIIKK